MDFHILHRGDLDSERWDALVEQNKGAFFSYSWVLDALAENWCVLVAKDYSAGIALPFTVRLRQKIVYTPIFISYTEWLGDPMSSDAIERIIFSEFNGVEAAFLQSILGDGGDQFVCQWLNNDVPIKLGSQASRMLKKAVKNDLVVVATESDQSIVPVIEKELHGKFVGVSDQHFIRLKRSIANAKARGVLVAFELYDSGICVGGLLCFQNSHQLLYLKGATSEPVKRRGGMYLAMHEAINYAKSNELDFDFGGSRVEGVRRFNMNYGGEDTTYFFYRINRSPFWFNWLRMLRNQFRKI